MIESRRVLESAGDGLMALSTRSSKAVGWGWLTRSKLGFCS